MSPNIRLIAVDLDGTLLNGQSDVSPENAQAIRLAVARDIQVVPVSARPPFGMGVVLDHLEGDGYLIAYNGAYVLESRSSRVLLDRPMSRHDTLASIDLLRRHGLYIGYYAGMHWYVEEKRPEMEWERSALQRLPVIGDLTRVPDPCPHKMIVINRDDPASLEPSFHEIRQLLPHLNIHYSSHFSYEISDGSATKASALAFIADRLGLPASGVMAIGDNFNDLDMLTYAGLAVAVQNAPAEVREAADWVVPANTENGVAVAINRLLLENISDHLIT
jgi:Cof subfamily protein (haloacid dehalogenase superfamily)